MPRIARAVIPEVPHHVTQRGNNRQDTFFVPDDYRAYLRILAEQSERHGLRVHAYCLMPNHVHLVATPERENSLAKGVGRTHWIYAQYVNRLHGRSGHLWQGRFYSCALSPRHLLTALAYVELNPARAGLVREAWRYAWSSAEAHCGGRDATGLLDLGAWERDMGARAWRERLECGMEEGEVRLLRSSTRRGRPLGSDSFLSKLEKAVGRRLRPLPVGRPRKTDNKEGK